jgi:mannose-6-phosphate isomerase
LESSELYPFKFIEIYKPYIWGGTNLRKIGKDIKNNKIVAESWEISDHDDDISIVKNGPLAGNNLRYLIETFGEDLCPKTSNGRFPVLIKYIDANRKLSVQVHPNDDYARAHENLNELGKTECWFVMDAPPGAELIMGLKKGVDKQDFTRMIAENSYEEGLNRLAVSRGDFIFIKTGTVHAILEGIMVCEIQENSDTTYRLYDWGRRGSDGKPRPLHIDKAMDVINFPQNDLYEKYMEEIVVDYVRDKKNISHALVRCPYFNIDLLNYTRDFDISINDSHFNALNILDGSGSIHYAAGHVPFKKGETILIPRPIRNCYIKTTGVEMLKTFL